MTLATLGQLIEERETAQDAYIEDVWATACSDVDSNSINMARVNGCVVYRTAVIERLTQLAYTEADVTGAGDWFGTDDEF